ncbi:hypothetical protein [Rhodococcus wratislaviensis]|nr:hypothetical protein [Rhodococcus wratislaviensis]
MQRRPATFLVVGGGIGGLATALQIMRRDLGRASVLERAVRPIDAS